MLNTVPGSGKLLVYISCCYYCFLNSSLSLPQSVFSLIAEIAPNPMDQSNVPGPGGTGSLPLLHFPSILGCLECETLCQPFVGLLLLVLLMSVSLPLQLTFPSSDPSHFRLRASIRHAEQNLSQVDFLLLSSVVQPEFLFHLAGLLNFLCLGFFVIK